MSNQTFGAVREDPRLGFLIFDSLPPEIRRVIAFAPYKFAVYGDGGSIVAAIKSGMDARAIVDAILRVRDKRIAEVWGADHPMIGSRIPEKKPERRLAL